MSDSGLATPSPSARDLERVRTFVISLTWTNVLGLMDCSVNAIEKGYIILIRSLLEAQVNPGDVVMS